MMSDCASARFCHRGAVILRGCSTGTTPSYSPHSTCGGCRKRCIMHILDHVDAASLRSDIPDFRPGDTIKVHVNIVEGSRSRIQVFQGIVIKRHRAGARSTFTVRKIRS